MRSCAHGCNASITKRLRTHVADDPVARLPPPFKNRLASQKVKLDVLPPRSPLPSILLDVRVEGEPSAIATLLCESGGGSGTLRNGTMPMIVTCV
jgi:hypothetical protein